MGAPKGNKFWLLWEKSSRIYEPEALLEKALEYFTFCDENPLIDVDFVGKDATPVERKKMRAMTIQGFCGFAGISDETFANYSKEKRYFGIIAYIRRTIYTQKLEGAAAGLLNANIIARELGLKDNTDVTTQGEKIERTVIKWGDKEIQV